MLESHMGARLAARRRALGLTEADLATRADTAEIQITRWESGEERIPARHLLALAEILHCDIRYFFEGLPGVPRSKLRSYLRLVGGTGHNPAQEGGGDLK